MPILSNPNFINFLVLLATIFIPVYVLKRQKLRKVITWQIISISLPIVDVGEQKLQILYDGKPVNNLRQVVLKISNQGNMPIEATDFENNSPITFYFGKEAEVLNVEILDTAPSNFKARAEGAFNVSQEKVNLEPLLLNSKDAITFKALVVKLVTDDIKTSARITGVKELVRLTPPIIRSRIIRLGILIVLIILLNVNSLAWILINLGNIGGGWSSLALALFTSLGLALALLSLVSNYKEAAAINYR